ncbi:MAG: hypothetical protein IIC95_07045, partial [Chloroflexi bacterium]|nr:hypothetical protein [Chloroflexota bacterium]
MTIDIYTDGSCLGNPGPGGWGAVVVTDGAERELAGGERATTNQRMEVTAAIKGLASVPAGSAVTVHSDSLYVINTMTKGWKRKANTDLWPALDAVVGERTVTWQWVKGHAGHPMNERADRLAVAAANAAAGRAPARIAGGATDVPDAAGGPDAAGALGAGGAGGLTHLDAKGRAQMVDVGEKADTERVAVARGAVVMKPETLRLIRQVEAIDDSRYPSRWQLSTRVRSLLGLQMIHDTKIAQLRQQTAARARECIIQTIADESLDDAGRRLHQMQIASIVSGLLQKNELQQLGVALERNQPGDKWLNCMALADLHRRIGWIARGNGLAGTVNQPGWQSFNSHMRRARALLLQAWDINPSLPESSMSMMEMTMTVKGIVNEKSQFWFEQAVKADYEELRTYKLYRWSLQPRWGGSVARMLALGRDCLNGKQFDTNVPWQFHLSVASAIANSRDSRMILQSPRVFEDYKKLFEGYIENEGPELPSFRKSQLA